MTITLNTSSVRQETKKFLQLAVPLIGAQIAQSLTGFFDTIMMGKLGAQTLAAGGLASWTFTAIVYTTAGIVMGLSPLVAEAYGAGKKKRIEQLTRQGFWLVLILSIPMMIAIANFDAIMLSLGQTETTVTLANNYLDFILWGLFPAIGFIMLRGVVSGLSLGNPIIVIVIFGTLFNITGNYILGFGKFGFPRLELAGLGIASALSWWGMFIALIIYMMKHSQLKNYRFFHNLHHFKPNIIFTIIKVGLPICTFMALELGVFTIVTYMMGVINTETLAANQVVFQTIMVTFMIPYGMSCATTARVGLWLGRKNNQAIKESTYISVTLGFVVMTILAIVMFLFPETIVSLYLDVNDPTNSSLVKIAIPILKVASISQILDGVQKITYGALQGLQDNRMPVFLNIFAFWGVGLTIGYTLGFPLGWGGFGLWFGQSIGVATAAILFLFRFNQLIKNNFFSN